MTDQSKTWATGGNSSGIFDEVPIDPKVAIYPMAREVLNTPDAPDKVTAASDDSNEAKAQRANHLDNNLRALRNVIENKGAGFGWDRSGGESWLDEPQRKMEFFIGPCSAHTHMPTYIVTLPSDENAKKGEGKITLSEIIEGPQFKTRQVAEALSVDDVTELLVRQLAKGGFIGAEKLATIEEGKGIELRVKGKDSTSKTTQRY